MTNRQTKSFITKKSKTETMETIEFYGELKHETDMAYLIHDGINDIWIPKSKVEAMEHIKGDDYEFTIPLWFAMKKEIV